VYEHPLRWNTVDPTLFGDTSRPPARASDVLRGLERHAAEWCDSGGRLWPMARHLVHLVEGVSGARGWRRQLSQRASAPGAGADVLGAAALQLEQRGL
jgi:tRNA-dihydrouridine synthase A